jgi:hypothetical protein
MASMLPWKAELMNRAGRAVHVQFVMTAKIIYTAMAFEFPLGRSKSLPSTREVFFGVAERERTGDTVF